MDRWVGREQAQRVNVTAPDVAGFVTAVDVVLGPSPRPALAVALAVFEHDVTVCGVEAEAAEALTPYFGEFCVYCAVFVFVLCRVCVSGRKASKASVKKVSLAGFCAGWCKTQYQYQSESTGLVGVHASNR